MRRSARSLVAADNAAVGSIVRTSCPFLDRMLITVMGRLLSRRLDASLIGRRVAALSSSTWIGAVARHAGREGQVETNAHSPVETIAPRAAGAAPITTDLIICPNDRARNIGGGEKARCQTASSHVQKDCCSATSETTVPVKLPVPVGSDQIMETATVRPEIRRYVPARHRLPNC